MSVGNIKHGESQQSDTLKATLFKVVLELLLVLLVGEDIIHVVGEVGDREAVQVITLDHEREEIELLTIL